MDIEMMWRPPAGHPADGEQPRQHPDVDAEPEPPEPHPWFG